MVRRNWLVIATLVYCAMSFGFAAAIIMRDDMTDTTRGAIGLAVFVAGVALLVLSYVYTGRPRPPGGP